MLLTVRFLPKLTDALEPGFILQGLGLVIVLVWVTRIARDARLTQTFGAWRDEAFSCDFPPTLPQAKRGSRP